MNSGRYFIPNMMVNPIMIRNGYTASRGMGLFNRIAQGLRSFNWNRLLSGANKTLNVMNQTIPLVRQAKPMVSNVKNMLNLAKAFRSETSSNILKGNYMVNRNITKKNNDIIISKNKVNIAKDNSDMPTFFI